MRSPRLLRIREEVIEALRRLAEELGGEVYLFGSFARGDHLVDSDVDVVVVSEAFRGLDMPSRVAMVRLRLPGEYGFDIIALTPEEFSRALDTALFREASRYWVRIVGPGPSR